MNSRTGALIGLVLLAALAAWPRARPGRSDTNRDIGCAIVAGSFPRSDSLVVTVPQPECGRFRLILTGPPLRTVVTPSHQQVWEIPVALENAGPKSVTLPLALELRQAEPVQRGRILHETHATRYFTIEQIGPWRFTRASFPRFFLPPRGRTEVQVIRLIAHPLSQGFQLRFSISVGGVPEVPERERTPGIAADTGSPGEDIEEFIRGLALPLQQQTRALLRLPDQDLVVFGVTFGSPQDCLSACFYSYATGMRVGTRIGWIQVEDYDRSEDVLARAMARRFLPLAEDQFLFSRAFLDTLNAYPLFGRDLRNLLVESPHLPDELLVHLAEGLYADPNQYLTHKVAQAPTLPSSFRALTLLANLPDGHHHGDIAAARRMLYDLAPRLLDDPAVPARTLFALVQRLQWSRDSTVMRRLARHPTVRQHPAILAVISGHHPDLRAALLASVRARPQDVARLGEYLASPHRELGKALLGDPVAGTNPDILVVLANHHPGDSRVVWEATRRLPEDALFVSEPWYGPSTPRHR